MIARTALAIAAALSAGPALSEQVRVLSGEHEDFSRIVLVFKDPVTWKNSPSADGFQIEFDRGGLSLDLSRVFDLIPRDRIEDLRFDSQSSTLTIQSTCQCELNIFEAGKNTLGLDVRSVQTIRPRLPGKASTAAYFPFGTTALAPRTTDRSEPSSQETTQTPLETGSASANPKGELVDGIEGILRANLGRAATQGLVQVRPEFQTTENGRQSPDNPGGPGGKHIHAESVMDQIGFLLGKPAVSPGGTTDCLPAEAVDIPAWSSPTDVTLALSDARRDLDPNSQEHEQILTLARAYIGLGFGAEALATIQEFSVASVDAEVITALAQIMDDGVVDGHSPLESMEDCPGAYPLWSALAVSDISTLQNPDFDRLQNEFAQLPPHIRVHLGPILSRRLLDAGYRDVATVIRDATERLLEIPNPALQYLNVTSGLPGKEQADPDDSLRNIVASGSEQSPHALLELMEMRLTAGRMDQDLATLAEGMAHEHRGTDVGTSLLERAAVARAYLGEYGTALDLFLDARGNSTSDPTTTLSQIVQQMLDSESDTDLLLLFGTQGSEVWKTSLTRSTKLAVAERLLLLSLPNLADRLLEEFKLSDDPRPRQLRAEVALQKQEPALALSLVAGEQDPVSLHLRAEALSFLGQHKQAADLFEQAATPQAVAREAWLAGDAERIVKLGTDAQQSFAQRLKDRDGLSPVSFVADTSAVELSIPGNVVSQGRRSDIEQAGPGSAKSLSVHRLLVTNSRETRLLISDLLADN